MSKYTAEFTAIDNTDYLIQIETESGSDTNTFLLSGNPLTTTMDCDGETIYTPIKCTGATISILADSLPTDVYSGSAKGTKVKVSSDGVTVWTGYLTPLTLDMDYDYELEEVQLECVDGISVLKSYPYQTSSAEIKTFAAIIFDCLKASGCFSNLYVTDNVQLTAGGSDSIIEKLRISESNFFNKKDDINQSDSEVAWSCYDVLYEIMQYLGYTMFADGEDVFVIDYDAIKKGDNRYFKYSLSGATIGTAANTQMKHESDIQGSGIAQSGSRAGIDKIYNKVSVKDDFYTYDSLFEFPNIGFERNITAKSDIRLTDPHYLVKDCITEKIGNREETYQIFIAKGWRDKKWLLVFKFYDSDFLSFEKYSKDAAHSNKTASFGTVKFSDILDNFGSFYARYYKMELKDKQYNDFMSKYPNINSLSEQQRKDAWVSLLNKKVESVDFQPIVINVNHPTNHIGPTAYNATGKYAKTDNEDCRKYPYIKLKGTPNASILGGENAYVIISADWSYHDEDSTPFPLSNGTDNPKLKREGDLKCADEGYIWARFKWGGVYWDGDSWVSHAADFKMKYWDDEKNRKDRKNKETFDKDFPLVDTASAKYAVSEKGYYIPAPQGGNLNGTVEFIIYCPRDMRGKSRRSHWNPSDGNYYSRYYQYVTFLKNLKIKAYIASGFLDDKENDSDTVYVNVIGNSSVEELGEITFKVNTHDNKKPNYSSVDYLDGGSSKYVCKTVNKALAAEESGSVSAFDGLSGLTQEEHLIFKLVKQYETPKIIYEVNTRIDGNKLYGTYTTPLFQGKTFIASEINTDFRMGRQRIKLIEKN